MNPTRSSAFIPPDDQTLDLSTVQVVKLPQPFWEQKETFVNYVPTSMGATTSIDIFYQQFTQGLQNKLTQKLTDYLLKSDVVKDSGVSKTVDTVQKVASQSASFQSANGITHKFAFNVQPAARTAVATYEGYFKLSTVYAMDTNNMTVALSKNLTKTTTISLTNTSPAGQFNNSGMLSLSHTF